MVAFIFADLLILPILNIYRKYYGTRMTLVLLSTFYAAMVGTGYLVELIFGVTSLVPQERSAIVMDEGISWNYTTWLNIAFLILAAVLLVRFFSTGGREMLQMMGGTPEAMADHGHSQHPDHSHHDQSADHPAGEHDRCDRRRTSGR